MVLAPTQQKTSQHEASCSLLGPVPPPLTLRVCGSEHDGFVLRLRSPKCTVGSDPTCTLRLQSDEIRPFHCLILRGAAGTFVRRWSAGTTLNGSGFELAQLCAGDRLRVGAVEFEVLPESVPEETATSVCVEAVESTPVESTPDWPREREQLQVQSQELTAEIDRLRQSLAAQEKRAEGAEVEYREQLASLRGELAAAVTSGTDQRTAQAELAAKAEAAVTQIVSLHEQVTQLRGQLEQQRRDTSTSRGQLESELAACRGQLSEAREQLEQAEQRDRDWAATRGQLEAELDACRQRLAAAESQYADSLATAQARSQTLEEELRAIRAEVESWQQDRLPRSADSAAASRPVVTEVMPSESPCSTLALDPRELTAAALEAAQRDDVSDDRVGSPVLEGASPASADLTTAADAVSPSHTAGGEDDESEIHRYMERLLRRVGNTSGKPETPAIQVITPAVASTPVDAPVPVEPSDEVSQMEQVKRREPVKAEAQEDVVAMRDLAQRSSRIAIHHSDRRTQVKAMFGEVCVAGVCLVSGILAAAMSRSTFSVETIGGAIGISFGLVLSARAAHRIRQLRKQAVGQTNHAEL